MTHRVMQITETGEEFNVHEGSEEDCDVWIEAMADQYPESCFYVEQIHNYRNFDYNRFGCC